MKARRRGVMLTIAVIVMGVVTGLFTVLTVWSAQLYRERQGDAARRAARSVADSAADWARAKAISWAQSAPAEPIELDAAALLPRNASGGAIVRISGAAPSVCHVTAKVTWGSYESVQELDVQLVTPPSPSTSTATAP